MHTSQYESLRGRALVIWLVITLSMLRIASRVSGQIILIHAYGWGRVSREHLQMARLKPLLVVSNGDVLLVVLAFKLLPQPYREAMKGGGMKGGTYAIWSTLSAIFLFFALNMLPLETLPAFRVHSSGRAIFDGSGAPGGRRRNISQLLPSLLMGVAKPFHPARLPLLWQNRVSESDADGQPYHAHSRTIRQSG